MLNETLIPLTDVPEHLPGRLHRSTAFRWASRGVRSVKLETILVGGRRYTSTEAIARFLRGVTAAAANQPTPTADSDRRAREIDQADAEVEHLLASAGRSGEPGRPAAKAR